MFYGFIAGMDTFALGLIKAAQIIEDGRIDEFIKERYSSYSTGIGEKIRNKSVTLEECAEYAAKLKKPELPESGRQEYLETVVNNILFNSKL
jgi:xylose isomerase